MATKKELEQKRGYAKLLFMQGETQKVIAEKVGVSAQTITKWVNDYNWSVERGATGVTRQGLVNQILEGIGLILDKLKNERDPDKFAAAADRLVKLTASVEKLDKKGSSVIDVIEVFTAWGKWLKHRMEYDPEVTPELLQTVTRYQELFIAAKMSNEI